MGKRIDAVIAPNGPDMKKFGHVELSVNEEELKKVFDFGDILKVTVDGFGTYIMPFHHYYDEVGIGELVLCTYTKRSMAVIARNYRSIGVDIGLLETDAKCGNFKMKNKIKEPVPVAIELVRKAEKQAKTCFATHGPNGRRTCDFRMISGGRIKDNVLFRSSSPIDSRLADCATVDEKAKEVGIRSFIDLADSKKEAESFQHFRATYCSQRKIAYLGMPLDVKSSGFKQAICEGVTFIANREPPFLVFCSEGRDRTGIFSALLQCFCGAELDEIVSDHIYSFKSICDDEEKATVLHNSERSLRSNLCRALGVKELNEGALEQDTEKYFLSIGIEQDVVLAAKNVIGAQKHG